MSHFFLVLYQIGIFVMLLSLGVLCRKIRILNEVSLYSISQLVVKVALPAFIFVNTANSTSREVLLGALPILLAALSLYTVLILLSTVLEKAFRLKGNRRNVFRMCLMFGNGGLIGVPLAVGIYPENALVYFGLITVIDMVMIWTYGVALSYDVESEGAKGYRLTIRKFLRMMINPALISVLLSIVFILFGLKLPGIVNTVLEKTGNLLSPLGMIYMGAMLNWKSVKASLRRTEIYAEILLKMLVVPLLFFFVMLKIGLPEDMAGTFAVFAGLPTFMVSMMLAKNNGSDGDYAVGFVMMTTLACLVTYPMMSLLQSVLPC